MTQLPSLRSRLLGTLYGLAAGDALGAPFEFQRRGSYTPTKDMEESHTFLYMGKPMPPGTWTDDTSMALCVAKSLLDHGEMKWVDAALNMVKWYKEGYLSAVNRCFDIGNTICIALEDYYSQILSLNPRHPLSTPLPADFSLVPCPNTAPSSSGNGSLMRLSPVPAFFHRSFAEAIDATDVQGRITHSSVLCVEACRLACTILLGLLEETSCEESCEERKKKVLREGFLPNGADTSDERLKYTTKEVIALIDGAYKQKKVEEIRTSGFVIHSLEAALWALWKASSYEEGLFLLLPLGEDVDTVCAIYGQFAGALYGVEAIPSQWINALQRRDLLDEIFEPLVKTALGLLISAACTLTLTMTNENYCIWISRNI